MARGSAAGPDICRCHIGGFSQCVRAERAARFKLPRSLILTKLSVGFLNKLACFGFNRCEDGFATPAIAKERQVLLR